MVSYSDHKVSCKQIPNQDVPSLCCNMAKNGGLSETLECFACGNDNCCGQSTLEKCVDSRSHVVPQNQNSGCFVGWILRKRKHLLHRGTENDIDLASGSVSERKGDRGSMTKWDFVDKALLGGISISIVTIIALIVALNFSVFSPE